MRNESDSGWTLLHNPPASILWENGLSVSMHVGTRKVRFIVGLFCVAVVPILELVG